MTTTPAPAPPVESPEPVRRTWMPTTAGILSLIAGILNLIAAAVGFGTSFMMGRWGMMGDWGWGMMGPGAIGIPLIILGIISIIGGIFAIQRRLWGLALAGAICALFPPPVVVFGILSIIFVAMGKKEFGCACECKQS